MRSESKNRTRMYAVVEPAVVTFFLAMVLCSAQLCAQTNEELRVFQVAPHLPGVVQPAEANEGRDVGAATNQTLEGYLSNRAETAPSLQLSISTRAGVWTRSRANGFQRS